MWDFIQKVMDKIDNEDFLDEAIAETPNPVKAATPIPTPELNTPQKIGFFKARMNKDNFWNLVFWLGTSMSVFITQLLADIFPSIIVLLFATIILSPYLFSRLNKVAHKDDMFHSTSTKRELCKYMPRLILFMIWLGIPFTTFWVFFIHDRYRALDECFGLYNLIFWFTPIMYCILKNLPISIIFNKTAWTKVDPAIIEQYGVDHHRSSSSSLFSNSSSTSYPTQESILTSPRYSSISGNIYHRR